MKRILFRSIFYFCAACVISIITVRLFIYDFVIRIFSTLSILCVYVLSFYDISINGDKCIKTIEPQLYDEFVKKRFKYDIKPLFIASQLIASGKFRSYPKLKLILVATLFYYLLVIVLFINTILVFLW